MANPTSRQSLIDYCLRRLGDPVIEINVDLDQLEDRVDEALQYWQEFHSEATYRTYVSHLVGDSDVSREYIQYVFQFL
jgi:tryptophan synthase beta subunit